MEKAVKKVETVTLKDLAAELVDTHSLPKGQVNTMLTEMVASLGKHLKKGSRIRIQCTPPMNVGAYGPITGIIATPLSRRPMCMNRVFMRTRTQHQRELGRADKNQSEIEHRWQVAWNDASSRMRWNCQ